MKHGFLFQDTFKFTYQKSTPGENFDGLDLLTKLLTPATNGAQKKATVPLIEELSPNDESCPAADDEHDDDGDQWFIDQNYSQEPETSEEISLGECVSKYGFALTRSNVFSKLSVSFHR